MTEEGHYYVHLRLTGRRLPGRTELEQYLRGAAFSTGDYAFAEIDVFAGGDEEEERDRERVAGTDPSLVGPRA